MMLKISKTLYSGARLVRIESKARALYSTTCLHQRHLQFHTSVRLWRITSPIFNNNCFGQSNVGSMQIRAMSGEVSGSISEKSVKKTISDNPLVVYSKTTCGFSSEVKALFRKLGADAHVVELDRLGSDGYELQKILEKLTGQRTVPNVFIGGKHIGGCSDTLNLHDKGELEALLEEADAI